MLALWVILGVIGFILVVWMAVVFWLFMRIFWRKKSKFFLDISLIGTHYEPYVEPLTENIRRMIAREYKKAEIVTDDGLKLVGHYYDNGGSDKTAILVHGYTANPFNNLSVIGNLLIEHGYNVLLIVQRAHDESEGRFVTAGVKEQYDLVKWVEWVEKNTATEQMFVYGVSMGGATVAYASDKLTSDRIKALGVDCSYTVFADQIRFLLKSRHIPVFLVLPVLDLYSRIFLGFPLDKYRATDSLAKTKYPCIFIYSKGDTTIPFSDIERNYNACPTEKKLFLVDKAGHTASMLASGKEGEKELFEFLDKYIH